MKKRDRIKGIAVWLIILPLVIIPLISFIIGYTNLDFGRYSEAVSISSNRDEVREAGILTNTGRGNLPSSYVISETEGVVRNMSALGFVTLITALISLLYARISTLVKNRRLIRVAYYDALTGLPNQLYLQEHLPKKIRKNRNEKKAILLIDLCDFRIINMTYGLDYGEQLLKKASLLLKQLENDDKLLMRFASDQFVLYAERYDEKSDLIYLADAASELLLQPIAMEDAEHSLRVKVSIVEIDSQDDSMDFLMRDVLLSLNRIVHDDSMRHVFFDEVMKNKLQREDQIEKELRAALLEKNTQKLYLNYQPQVDLKNNGIIGFEALARMNSDTYGSIPPLEFIDIAERKNLMVPLGQMLLYKACSFIGKLNKRGYRNIKVAVNISGVQLLRDDFMEILLDIFNRTGISKNRLRLEINESIITADFDKIKEKLKRINGHGIEIAMDDFGAGYSSFSRLEELQIDAVKIDRYFVSTISEDDNRSLITAEIIAMAHKLNLKVIAKGVEDENQRRYLAENSCDAMQGYLFSKPVSEEEAIEMMM